MNRKDKEILPYITNVSAEYLDNKKSFKISFFFNTNKFFTNDVLTITFTWTNESDQFTAIEGCTINWLISPTTKKIVKKKIKSN